MNDGVCDNHEFVLCSEGIPNTSSSVLGSCVYEKNNKGRRYIYVKFVLTVSLVCDHTITKLISIVAGFIHNLAPFGLCDQYLDGGTLLEGEISATLSNCGCVDHLCRDLNMDPILHPVSFHFQPTCKQTATAFCKSCVQYLFNIVWIKVPTKDDKICRDLYDRIKIWATSCN